MFNPLGEAAHMFPANRMILSELEEQGYGYYMTLPDEEDDVPSRLYPDYESVEPFIDDSPEGEECDVGIPGMEARMVFWE